MLGCDGKGVGDFFYLFPDITKPSGGSQVEGFGSALFSGKLLDATSRFDAGISQLGTLDSSS